MRPKPTIPNVKECSSSGLRRRPPPICRSAENASAPRHPAGRDTVGRLAGEVGYSLRVDARRKDAKSSPPERGARFNYMQEQKRDFPATVESVISVDTKSELIGEPKNAGCALCWRREAVLFHYFPLDAVETISDGWSSEGCRRYRRHDNPHRAHRQW